MRLNKFYLFKKTDTNLRESYLEIEVDGLQIKAFSKISESDFNSAPLDLLSDAIESRLQEVAVSLIRKRLFGAHMVMRNDLINAQSVTIATEELKRIAGKK